MLNITTKTTRQELLHEIDVLRTSARIIGDTHTAALEALKAKHAEALEEHERGAAGLRDQLAEAKDIAGHLAHKAEVAETDVHNLLGALRVMADSSRSVRIRSRSVQSADMATALPYRNTDKI
jgi:ubiquinone biosynthesis protein COQ9